jgi:hypothetical protein
VALKKPSDFFNKKTTFEEIQEQLVGEEPQKIENITEAFQVFKTNLNHIQSLSDFSSTINGFKENFEKIDFLSQEIEVLKEGVDNTLKKEDLNEAMMSHLLFVEESIESIQKKIKGLNSKTLYDIKEEFEELQETVIDFINLEVPSYKKQILDHERRIDNRFLSFKEGINESIERIDEDTTIKLSNISETISSINEDYLERFKNEVSILDDKVDHLLEDELPKYKKFFVETEFKTEEKINSVTDFVESKVNTLENDYQNQIQSLNLLVKEFIEQEIPKYKSLITESKIKVEKDFIDLEETIQNKIQQIDESVSSLIQETKLQNQDHSQKVTNQLLDLQQIVENSKNQIDSISNTYESLYKDFRKREIHENEKLESYQNLLDSFSEKIAILENNFNDDVCSLQETLDISTSKYYDVLKKEVGYFEENISSKVKDLEVNIVVNEKHIKDIQNSVYEVLDNLKINLIEEKNKELTKKIFQIESILEKFNEQSVLNEGLLNEPPNIKNSDPLTPLDQNYVTLSQLQEHYRIFINRIQQQLSTIGGGGAVRLDDLDDVDRSSITTNKLLIYNGTNWVGIASTALSGGGGGSSTLIGLSDVDSSNLGDGRFLRYDASANDFTFAPVSATNLELIAGDIQSGVLTTTSTSPAIIASISASTYRSVQYQIQVTESTNYNMTIINILHDGTLPYIVEYGTINQPIGIATFSSDISGGALRLIGYPEFVSPTTFKVIFTAIES